MVQKFKAYRPLTIEQRIKIKEGIDLGMSYREIAIHADRFKSTVMREAKRLGDVWSYDPYKAQEDAEAKQKLVGIKKK